MPEQQQQLTPEQTAQAREYAKALGHDPDTCDAEYLRRMMDSIARDCAQWGCD